MVQVLRSFAAMNAIATAFGPRPRAAHLAPLQVLPVQFMPDARARRASTPEYQLMAAVLEDAITVYRKLQPLRGRGGRKMRRELQAWFRANDDQWLFSFRNCCEVLDLDAGRIRDQLGVWQEWRPSV